MHRDFRELLPAAVGDSELVIVTVADVRGFSRFSERVESVEAALYIKKIYMRILDDYFADSDFFKPTGDGLLIVTRVQEENLRERSNEIVRRCTRLVADFPTLVADDPLINFPTPTELGIGLARGAASRLTSGEKTLDYSGRVLNLASRLMDLARPSGVVIDEAYRIDLLDEDVQALLTEASVYIRSVAEDQPRTIYHTADVKIRESNLRPLDSISWAEQIVDLGTLRQLRDVGNYRVDLRTRPRDPERIQVTVRYPAITPGGRRSRTLTTYSDRPADEFAFFEDAGRPVVRLHLGTTGSRLADAGVRDSWPVVVRVAYPEA